MSEAKTWLSDHDYTPLMFEPATGKAMTNTIDIKSINKEVHRREAPQGLRVEERTDAGLTFSFSSEAPVERWWGREILVHDADSMDLARMNDGGAWLWNHNRDVVLGVAEKAGSATTVASTSKQSGARTPPKREPKSTSAVRTSKPASLRTFPSPTKSTMFESRLTAIST